MKKLYLILLLFGVVKSKAQLTPQQERQIDSLRQIIKTTKSDTVRLNAMYAWDGIIYVFDADLDLKLSNEMLALARKKLTKNPGSKEKFFYQKFVADALNNIGLVYAGRGDYKTAEKCYKESYAVAKKINSERRVAHALNNLGNLKYSQGAYKQSISYYNKTLVLAQKNNSIHEISSAYNNLANSYQEMGNTLLAIKFHTKGLELAEKTKDQLSIATSYLNIGNVYGLSGNKTEALNFYNKALHIAEKIENSDIWAGALASIGNITVEQGKYAKAAVYLKKAKELLESSGNLGKLANVYCDLANLYAIKKEYTNAFELCNRALAIQQQLNDLQGKCASLSSMAYIYLETGKFAKSIELAKASLKISREIGFLPGTRSAYKVLMFAYEKQNDYKNALLTRELFAGISDSISNKDSEKEIVRQEYRYLYAKKAMADSVKHAQKHAVLSAKLKEEETQRYVLYGGIVLFFLLAAFIIQRFRVTQKQGKIILSQKVEVDRQKLMIEEKQAEIMDSIHYAKRIQKALLPSERYMVRCLGRSKK